MKEKYKQAFMEMATVFAKTSEANRLKVGALIVKDEKVISLGINGTIKGWYTNTCEDEKGETEWFVRHAEHAALNKLRTSHESSVGAEMFVTHSPCLKCCLEIIDAGITKVYYKDEYKDRTGISLLKEYGVDVEKLA